MDAYGGGYGGGHGGDAFGGAGGAFGAGHGSGSHAIGPVPPGEEARWLNYRSFR